MKLTESFAGWRFVYLQNLWNNKNIKKNLPSAEPFNMFILVYQTHWKTCILVNIGSGNGLVPHGAWHQPLPVPIFRAYKSLIPSKMLTLNSNITLNVSEKCCLFFSQVRINQRNNGCARLSPRIALSSLTFLLYFYFAFVDLMKAVDHVQQRSYGMPWGTLVSRNGLCMSSRVCTMCTTCTTVIVPSSL